MGRPWYVTDSPLYESVRSQIQDVYPDLRCTIEEGKAVVSGYYCVADNGGVLDRYSIRMILPEHSCRDIPEVYETANRIQRDDNHHMGEDGRACVVLPDAFWYAHPEGMTPLEFLDGPVRTYFANQSLMERGGGAWPAGEWRHGVKGIIEFYGDVLGTTDLSVVQAFLEVLSSDVVRGHRRCPCGSGKRTRDCHLALILELGRRIPKAVAARSASGLSSPRMRQSNACIRGIS